MMERMKLLGPLMGPKTMNADLRQKVVNWLCSNEFEGEERSMRTLHKALSLAAANPKNWKSMCQILWTEHDRNGSWETRKIECGNISQRRNDTQSKEKRRFG